MNIKNIISLIIISLALVFYFLFVKPFEAAVLDPVTVQLEKIKSASEKTQNLLSLNNLRQKKLALGERETSLLSSFIPLNLRSGDLIYRLSGVASQNRLTLKGIQFSDVSEKDSSDKKLLIDMNLDGSYEDFYRWLGTIERSSTLIDVESIRATKSSGNNSDLLSFTVKMYAYGINID